MVSSREAIVWSHAIIATLVWAFIIPVGGIIFRLNIKSKWVYRVHAFLQITGYLAYAAAVGLGIWMANNFSTKTYNMWTNPHIQLGLAILGIAFIMPPLGLIHHIIYKRRAQASAAGEATKAPGRTWFAVVHVWVGRSLIILGMVNGGLGIGMGLQSKYQKKATLRNVAIGYSVGCVVMAIIYCAIVIPYEIKKNRQEKLSAMRSKVDASSSTDDDSDVVKRG